MTFSKRLIDLGLAMILLAVLLPVMAVIAVLILYHDGRPVIYRSHRMKTPDQTFTLLKFRTMTQAGEDDTVSAGYKAGHITHSGRLLRKKRLDELPQLFNILRGDMSFVGPRPPLPRYVKMRPDLYAKVLRNRPGVTGLATLIFHSREEKILADCKTTDATHQLYLQRCVPIKARLDLIWARNQSNCYDLLLIFWTIARVFSPWHHSKNGKRK